MTVWIVEKSKDGGKTWLIYTPLKVYVHRENGEKAIDRMHSWHHRILYRLAPFKREEVKQPERN
jgi:hypothetical protein